MLDFEVEIALAAIEPRGPRGRVGDHPIDLARRDRQRAGDVPRLGRQLDVPRLLDRLAQPRARDPFERLGRGGHDVLVVVVQDARERSERARVAEAPDLADQRGGRSRVRPRDQRVEVRRAPREAEQLERAPHARGRRVLRGHDRAEQVERAAVPAPEQREDRGEEDLVGGRLRPLFEREDRVLARERRRERARDPRGDRGLFAIEERLDRGLARGAATVEHVEREGHEVLPLVRREVGERDVDRGARREPEPVDEAGERLGRALLERHDHRARRVRALDGSERQRDRERALGIGRRRLGGVERDHREHRRAERDERVDVVEQALFEGLLIGPPFDRVGLAERGVDRDVFEAVAREATQHLGLFDRGLVRVRRRLGLLLPAIVIVLGQLLFELARRRGLGERRELRHRRGPRGRGRRLGALGLRVFGRERDERQDGPPHDRVERGEAHARAEGPRGGQRLVEAPPHELEPARELHLGDFVGGAPRRLGDARERGRGLVDDRALAAPEELARLRGRGGGLREPVEVHGRDHRAVEHGVRALDHAEQRVLDRLAIERVVECVEREEHLLGLAAREERGDVARAGRISRVIDVHATSVATMSAPRSGPSDDVTTSAVEPLAQPA